MTYNNTKAQVVERFNRTFKTRLQRYLTHKKTQKFIKMVQPLADAYNASYHRSIREKPHNVSVENQQQIWENLYPDKVVTKKRVPKFKVGDHVRILRLKNIFAKGYSQVWTEEVFIVTAVS